MNLWQIFNAGRCRRWHTHPVMADYDDRLDAHQGRVARLAMALFPGDDGLIRAALIHDDGEAIVGDVPNPVKNRLPQVARDALDDMERIGIDRMWGYHPPLSVDQAKRLRLCDKLDAIMWARHKAPHMMTEPGWQADIAEVIALAAWCGVSGPVTDICDVLGNPWGMK